MKKNWWDEIDALLAEKSLLKHPFYQAWTAGALTRGDLALYAREYYQQESRFPGFVEAVLELCGDADARRALEDNLADERGRGKNPSHPERWLRFAASVGASRESVLFCEPAAETLSCVQAYETLTCADAAKGLSALYAYEAQQPAVAAAKLEGLKTRYGLSGEDALGFFEAHAEADVWHSDNEKKALLRAVEAGQTTPAKVAAAVSEACDALNTLLDGVWARCEARKLAAC